jgi:raffinose/stachyose/melibiose transport system permease protein
VTWAEVRRGWQAYALLSPVFILLIIFQYYPPILGFIRAFYEWAPGREAVFVGLGNFRSYLTYPETVGGLTNMVKILYWGLLTGVVCPFVMAELVFQVRSVVAKETYRLLLVIPLLAPGIVTTLVWKNLYDPEFGPINALLRAVGLDALTFNWLGDPRTALYAIIGVGLPWVSGIGTLIVLGGLGQISESVFDSCLLDGCTGLRRIFYVDLPLLMGQVRLLTILTVVSSITAFDRILVLTKGGPGFATSVPALMMYERAFMYQQFGHASAIGLILFLISLGLTVVVNRTVRSTSY